MSKYLILGLFLALLSTGFFIYHQNQPKAHTTCVAPISYEPQKCIALAPIGDGKRIQVALLLDTSNSMDGLIEQTKSQLWKMVNELASSKKDGQTPQIEIALYQYGNDNLSISKGYIRQISSMTSDLDYISEQLFSLSTKGGSEYSPWAVRDAAKDLRWTIGEHDLKMIIIAGNEPFEQGPISYEEACEMTQEKNIIVNTIHCGDYQIGIKEGWNKVSSCTNGQYLNIDQDDKVVHIATPYDEQVIELNNRLNQTYINYGLLGQEKKANQMVQDANAANYSMANLRTRAFCKSKDAYTNSNWDLVDKAKEDEAILDSIEEEALPENMQRMSQSERKEYLENMKKERETIQVELQQCEEKVRQYVAEKRKEMAETQTLDNVLINTMKEQAQAKDFQFE